MRTTIELPNALRARLLELAAQRGEKGFSRLVREALERYLATIQNPEEERRRAAAALGGLSRKEADELKASVRRVRDRWR